MSTWYSATMGTRFNPEHKRRERRETGISARQQRKRDKAERRAKK